MHILDVTSNVSRSSKCSKIVGGWELAPEELTALPRSPWLDLRSRPLLIRGGRESDKNERCGRKERGRQNDL